MAMDEAALAELVEAGRKERAKVTELERQIGEISRTFNKRVLLFLLDEGYEAYAYVPQGSISWPDDEGMCLLFKHLTKAELDKFNSLAEVWDYDEYVAKSIVFIDEKKDLVKITMDGIDDLLE